MCSWWDFKLGVSDDEVPFTPKREKKSGCQQAEPFFQTEKNKGAKPHWDLPKFRESRSYNKYMTKSDLKRKASGVLTGEKKSSSKKKKRKVRAQVSFADELPTSSGGFDSKWTRIFGVMVADPPGPEILFDGAESVPTC